MGNPSMTISAASSAAPQVAGVGDYLALLKPRVMSLVVFTAFVGLVLAPGGLHPVLGFVALLCIAVGAGASGAINMWYEADIDALMSRTCDRPLPRGVVAPGDALGFGVSLAVASVALMGLAVGLLPAFLLAFTIAFYVFVYTIWLKRRTPQNIVIGGLAGALPPLIGWAAASGQVGLEPLALVAIIFFWTPPHFWALALYRGDDYARAGVPMLPLVAGERATRRQILAYSLALVPLTITPWALGTVGALYGILALGLGVALVLAAGAVWRARPGAERRLFGFSILYLFLLFALMLVDRGLLGVA
jgi:protoheme IX farnesyltransferase